MSVLTADSWYSRKSEWLADARERMCDAEFAEYSAYLDTVPVGGAVFWACTISNNGEPPRAFGPGAKWARTSLP